MRIALHLLFFILFIHTAFSQDEVLFTVGDTKVNRTEFEYIYNKNNFNNKSDYTRQSLKDYLDLYINFRLKVKEAIAQGLDQGDRFRDELTTYENQLLDSYLDKEVLEKTIKQEFERGKKDVSLSHIFFKTSGDAASRAEDTYNKIQSGALTFETALPGSDDQQTLNNGGYLGWYNSLQIALPELEDVAYSLQPGQISKPVKTKLGYHIVKLNEVRPARKKLRVAIIKKFLPVESTGETGKALEDTMKYIYAQLKAGVPFEQLVTKYSDDEFSRANGGQLEWFGINTYAKVFEDKAYSMKPGEYSEPLKTKSAWYIIKLIDTAKTQSFEEATPVLKARLATSPQYLGAMDQFISKLKTIYNAQVNTEYLPVFKERLKTMPATYPFTYRDTTSPKWIMNIGGVIIDENKLGKVVQQVFYVTTPQANEDRFDAMVTKAQQFLLIEHYKNEIRKSNPEFRALMDEYRNGIMIFDLSEKNIWNRAAEDSAGLMAYYHANKEKFKMGKHATSRTITTPDLKTANAIYKFLTANPNVADAAISDKLKSLGVQEPQVHAQTVEEGKSKVQVTVATVSKPVQSPKGFVISQVYNLQPERIRAFEECRGYVVAAYQENIEKAWLTELRAKYPVTVNQLAFEKMVKQPPKMKE